MEIQINEDTQNPDKFIVINKLWDHNKAWAAVNIEPLLLTIRDKEQEIVAGLVAQTWWDALEIQYLWVKDTMRYKGYGKKMMIKAEEIAVHRGCKIFYVDTFDFQASGFYEKLGYQIYGELDGYAGKFTRYYLSKKKEMI